VTPSQQTPLSDLKRIDAICQRFEEAWQSGEPPPLGDFLADEPEPLRRRLFVELVQADTEMRRERDMTIDLELYRAHFPEYANVLATIFDGLAREVSSTGDRAAEPARPSRRTAPPAESLRIAGYEVLRELGRGGMGVVYLARHLQLRRQVALKLILAGPHAGEEVMARFHAEARTVARLSHPNIVQVYEVGEHEGRPYLALEYVEGGSLEGHLARTPQPPRDAAQLLETMARAVHHAHQQGVVHRDLKPANVLLASGGRQPPVGEQTGDLRPPLATPKITDFGLAKQTADSVPDVQTRTGAVIGTPSYMAPEQARGTAQAIGPATDVYALGVILYEMLTGRPPFLGLDVFDTLVLVCTQEPTPPSRLQARTPRDLETICLKCLHKEPHRRYLTAEALADDLRRWLDGRPIRARPVGPLARAARWCRRNPVVAALTATVILATLLGSGFSVWFGVQASINANNLLVKTGQLQTRTDELETKKGELETKTEELERTALRLAAEKTAAENATREVTLQKEVVERQLLRNRWLGYAGLLENTRKELQGDDRDAARRDRATDFLDRCPWDMRHWEHAYLRKLCSGSQPVRHKLPPGASAALSADGLRLATADGERKIRLWDATTGQLVRLVGVHGDEVPNVQQLVLVCISPDGRLIASGSAYGSAQLWDATTGKELAKLVRAGVPDLYCRDIAITSDGSTLITVGLLLRAGAPANALEVVEWDLATRQPRHVVTIPAPALTRRVLIGPNNRLFTAREISGEGVFIDVWDLRSGAKLGHCQWLGFGCTALACTRDGTRIAAADQDNRVRVWDAATGQLQFTLRGHKDAPSCLAFSSDGKRLVSGATGELRFWDLTTEGQGLLTLPVPGADLTSLAFTADGKRLAGTAAAEVVLWEATPEEADALHIEHDQGRIAAAVFTPDGKRIVTGGARERQAGMVQVWDATTGELLHTLGSHTDRVVSVAVSRDGRIIVSGGGEDWPKEGNHHVHKPGEVKVWDAQTKQCLRTLGDHAGAVWTVAISPDGQRIASGSQDRTVHLYNASTGERIRTLEGHALEVQSVAFSPDGAYLVSGSGELGRRGDTKRPNPRAKEFIGEVIVWETSTGKRLRTIELPGTSVNGVCFSPDGTRVAAGVGRWMDDPRGFHRGAVKVWDVATGQEALTLEAGPAAVYGVCFSPDGRRLAAGRGEAGNTPGTALVWEIATGKRLRSLGNFPHLCVAFDRLGNRLVCGGEASAIVVWGVPPEEAPVPGWHHR
jgi:WD40 repeat protein/serine/threonine protein kinase